MLPETANCKYKTKKLEKQIMIDLCQSIGLFFALLFQFSP